MLNRCHPERRNRPFLSYLLKYSQIPFYFTFQSQNSEVHEALNVDAIEDQEETAELMAKGKEIGLVFPSLQTLCIYLLLNDRTHSYSSIRLKLASTASEWRKIRRSLTGISAPKRDIVNLYIDKNT